MKILLITLLFSLALINQGMAGGLPKDLDPANNAFLNKNVLEGGSGTKWAAPAEEKKDCCYGQAAPAKMTGCSVSKDGCPSAYTTYGSPDNPVVQPKDGTQ